MRVVCLLGISVVLLAAGCGGSAAPPLGLHTASHVSQPAAATALPVAVQRNAAQASLATEQGITLVTAILRPIIHAAQLGQSDGACKDGVEASIVYPAPGQATITVTIFYDEACTTRWQHLVVDVTGSSSLTVHGTQTVFTPGGGVVAYNAFTGTGTVQKSGAFTLEVRGKLAPSKQAKSTGAFGVACAGDSNGGKCGFGNILNVIPLQTQIGSTMATAETFSKGRFSGGVTTGAFAGAIGSLRLNRGKPSGVAWNVHGGTRLVRCRGTFAGTRDANGFISTMNLTLNDTTNDSRSKLAYANRANSGTIVQISNGSQAASYQTDAVGNGSITYSTGAKAKIHLFVIGG